MIIQPPTYTHHNSIPQGHRIVVSGGGGGGGASSNYQNSHRVTGTFIGGWMPPFKEEEPKWEPWFAWYPVKAGEKYKWLTTVYKKAIKESEVVEKTFNSTIIRVKQIWIYGTIFDKLKE